MSVEKEDKILFCRDCGEEFIFSAREQDFYAQKGFENDPVRCTTCRAQRKRTGGTGNPVSFNAPSHQVYNQGSSYGNGGNFGGYNPAPSYGNQRPNNYGNGNSGNYGNQRPNNYGNGNGGSYGNQRPNNYGAPRSNNYNNGNNGNGGGYGNQRPNNSYGASRPNSGYGNQNSYSNGGGYSAPRNTGYGNGGGYGNGNSNGGYSSQNNFNQMDRQRYPIVCANCGINTEVPFVPRDGVPVFCRTCYNSQKPNRN